MNISLDWIKKYWWVGALATYLGIGQFFEGLQPVFRYQMEAHASQAYGEMSQTSKKLDEFACMQIVINYQKAKAEGDANMVSYWLQQAQKFNCTLPS